MYVLQLITDSDSVLVHVIKSEHRAAMQHENNGYRRTSVLHNTLLIGTLSLPIRMAIGKQIGMLYPIVFVGLYMLCR